MKNRIVSIGLLTYVFLCHASAMHAQRQSHRRHRAFLLSGEQLRNSCFQTRSFRPEHGLIVRCKWLNPNNRAWDFSTC
jgi:hypothetical protein